MSPDKDAALVKDFPHVFRDRHTSMTQTAFCWGFECSDGWEPLIRETAQKLEPIIVKMMDAAIKEDDLVALEFIPTTSQVKEKYGTLRWYLTSGTDEMYKIVEKAENKSAKICEECGKLGKLRGESWSYTRCDACWKKITNE